MEYSKSNGIQELENKVVKGKWKNMRIVLVQIDFIINWDKWNRHMQHA